MRLRIQFEKTGPARFTSHKDVQRIVQRALASAGVPVAYTEGYHPHMKLSFGPPLRTGWESRAEYLDVEVTAPPGPLVERLDAALPEGFAVTGVALVASRAPKLVADLCAADYAVEIDADDARALAGPLEAALGERVSRERAVESDDTPRLVAAGVSANDHAVVVSWTATMHSGRTVTPADVLAPVVDDLDALARPVRVTRRAQYVRREGRLVSPISREAIRYAS